MKLQIRPTALEDLVKARGFYDLQELGVGDYFFDSVFTDIDSLMLYAGMHPYELKRCFSLKESRACGNEAAFSSPAPLKHKPLL